MLKKLAPRSGSSVRMAAISNVEAPSLTREPTGADSAVTRRSSTQTVPGFGPEAAGASAAFTAGAMRNLPRNG